MTCQIDISDELKKKLSKFQTKDKVLYEATMKKINEIIENPEHYKPLRHDLKGERRVHVKGSFVLVFEFLKLQNLVKFYDLDHHDKIYKKQHRK